MNARFTKCARVAALSLPLVMVASTGFAKKFTGAYTISYLSGPSHSLSATQCLVFTHTGNIVSFPNSGTWTATTFSGFSGNYVVDGKDLRFYGTFGSGTGVIAHHAKLGGTIAGGFDDFEPASSGASASNDGAITLTPDCSNAVRKPSSAASPTH